MRRLHAMVAWAVVMGFGATTAHGDDTVHPVAPPEAPMVPLTVEGFEPSLVVEPQGEGPQPVMIFLHGIRASVEEQCGWWKPLGHSYGWLLCLRGDREPKTTMHQDLWTYRRRGRVHKEIEAALKALEERYPGRVSREGTVLAGYSRGAIMAPKLALMAPPGRFPYLFLAEGGLDQLKKLGPRALQNHGVKGIGIAMGTVMRRRRVERSVLPTLQKAGMRAVFVDMPGAGHRIGPEFPNTAPPALRELLAQ